MNALAWARRARVMLGGRHKVGRVRNRARAIVGAPVLLGLFVIALVALLVVTEVMGACVSSRRRGVSKWRDCGRFDILRARGGGCCLWKEERAIGGWTPTSRLARCERMKGEGNA